VARPEPARPGPSAAAATIRGLRIVALAATLALAAIVVDARSRPRPPEPVVLLPIPEIPPHRPTGFSVARPAPPPAPERPAEFEAVVPPAERSPPAEPAAEPGPPSAPSESPSALPDVGPTPPGAAASAPTPSSPPTAADSLAGASAGPTRPPPGPSATAAATVRDGVLAYQTGDYAGAEAIWRPLAESGNARARFHLGALYLEGRLGRPDPEAAYRWLALAAEAGQAAAAPLRDQAAARLPPERVAAIRAELGLAP